MARRRRSNKAPQNFGGGKSSKWWWLELPMEEREVSFGSNLETDLHKTTASKLPLNSTEAKRNYLHNWMFWEGVLTHKIETQVFYCSCCKSLLCSLFEEELSFEDNCTAKSNNEVSAFKTKSSVLSHMEAIIRRLFQPCS